MDAHVAQGVFVKALPGLLDLFRDIVEHQRFVGHQVRVAVKDLVEKVAAVVGSQLGVPDQSVHFPDADGLDRVLAVVDAKAFLEVNGILADLLF